MSYPYLILHSNATGRNLKLMPDGCVISLHESVNYLTRAKVESATASDPVTVDEVAGSTWDALTFGPCRECDGDGFVIARKVVQIRKGLGGERDIKGYENHEDGELPNGFHPRYEPVDCRECDENGEALLVIAEDVSIEDAMNLFKKETRHALCGWCQSDFYPPAESDAVVCDRCLNPQDEPEPEEDDE